jgi:hypothetical protein
MEKILLPMFIQLFAEGDEDDIEDNSTEEVEEEFDDGDDEENEEEPEFDDGEEVEEEEEVEEKQQNASEQQRAENYRNALRRIEEKQRKELEKARKESYLEGVKASTGGVNRFTRKAIKDDVDVEIFKTMCEMEEKGLDPIDDYPEYVAEKQRQARMEEQKANEEQNAIQQRRTNELNDFVNSYGNETVERMLDDQEFYNYSKPFLDRVPLKDIYESFVRQKASIEARAEELAIEKDARRKSSPGSLGKKNKADKSFSEMTPEEFHEFSINIAKRY